MLVAIICSVHNDSFVATFVGVIRVPCSAKPDSGVWLDTVIMVVTKDTNPRFAALTVVVSGINCVKSFLHVLRPSEVARYLPSAISEYKDLA